MSEQRQSGTAQWIGHSTVLLNWRGMNILTDPVLGDRIGIRVGPLTIGPRRFTPPALRVPDLPKIDLILLSHAHMDHFDLPTLRRLESAETKVITARATSDLLRVPRWGGVTELGWDEESVVGPLTVRALRVRHWGARMQTDTHRGYNGYLLEAGGRRILFGGDTAYTDLFRLARGGGEIDLALMPIGAYQPWIGAHCNPEQAVRMADDAGAARILPIHHQTFRLSAEPPAEPLERLRAAAGDRVAGGTAGDIVPIRA